MKSENPQNIRYRLAPQMETYDHVGHVWLPYVMFFNSPNFQSRVVNTDSMGFRISHFQGRDISLSMPPADGPLNFFVGGSTAFGVGSSDDGFTVASLLSGKFNEAWLNLGGRAYSSTQELILFLTHAALQKRIKRIVLFSGMNNLVLYYLSRYNNPEFGTFFYLTRFLQGMAGEVETLKKPGWRGWLLGQKERMAQPGAATHPMFRKVENFDAQKDEFVNPLRRDLRLWKMITESMGVELFYVLQPCAPWSRGSYSPEEEQLFNALAAISSASENLLSQALTEANHTWLAGTIEEVCISENIPFLDLNSLLKERSPPGWLFVDRVHMTDEGYRLVSDSIAEFIARC